MQVFLDANVFLYAAGSDGARAAPCLRILRAVEAGQMDAITSTEVVQEVLHVVARRLGGVAAERAAAAVLDLVPVPVAVDVAVMRVAMELLRNQPQLGARDAVHAATMAQVRCTQIVSADKHFDLVAGLRRIDPLREDEVAAWLS